MPEDETEKPPRSFRIAVVAGIAAFAGLLAAVAASG
jgi:hypothetical protein